MKIDFHEIEKLIETNITLNKVNLANILFKNNIGKNINDAYNRYIKEFGNVPYFYISIDDILTSIKSDNGILLWAHPFVHHLFDSEIVNIIRKAKKLGIDGIEITPNHFLKSLYLAKQYSLCYSVGSDYHGQIFDKCNQLGINAIFFEHDENYIKNKIRR